MKDFSDGDQAAVWSDTSALLAKPGAIARPVPGAAPAKGYRDRGKRLFDVALVVLTLPFTLPLILLPALVLACLGHGAFYVQRRLGRDGRGFYMVKLRTMVPDADRMLQDCLDRDPALRREWDRTQKLKHDPRITRLGRFLRRSSLDELPQIWHVLTGEMSLVGPRPMMPHQLELYGDPRAYAALRPGITGLWQVMERNEADFASRARADREYDRVCSFPTDLKLIARTVGVVFRGTGY